jgi:hypothetical protein
MPNTILSTSDGLIGVWDEYRIRHNGWESELIGERRQAGSIDLFKRPDSSQSNP